MINLERNESNLMNNIRRARENGIIIPTFEQMKNPDKVPEKVREKLKTTGLWEINPLNLFRITWKNEPKESGGLFGHVNYIELPSALTGVNARIVCLVGKWFPTGCHKVGASFGCLVPRLVTGQFDADYHKAVWPSTGNYCRGGAFNSKLLSCHSIAILPEGMSRERFEWLNRIAGEVIATPGTESNVKEIFDKTWELRETREDCMIFNQFEEMGNHLWHYEITGDAMEEVFNRLDGSHKHFAGVCFTSGSAGTLGAGDYLKEKFPGVKIGAGEALQCPTLLNNGFGDHRIEGIGDKHVPWIHNVRMTDMVLAVDDEDSQRLLRLFNEKEGLAYLENIAGVPKEITTSLGLFGISGIANLLCSIKMAKYYEMTSEDVIMTVLTDSAEMYGSRVSELQQEHGPYSERMAELDHNLHMLGIKTDNMEELTYIGKKRLHNLKYYTWVEQQKKATQELTRLWYEPDKTWGAVHAQGKEIDVLINEFNERSGVLDNL